MPVRSTWKKSRFPSASTSWRRRLSGVGAIVCLLTGLALPASGDVRVDLVDGAIEVSGLSDVFLSSLAHTEWTFEEWTRVLRVAVSSDASPILGTHEVVGASLRFRPMFTFDAGRDYFVRLEHEGQVVTQTVSLPAVIRERTTRVTEVTPTAGVLPENQLKLYIHFSAPMAGGDGLEFVRLLDEAGEPVVDPFLPLGEAFWNRDRTRYTIFFDPGRVKQGILPNEQLGRPILAGHTYRLVIDEAWRDSHSVALVGSFEKRFSVGPADESPPDPENWQLTIPADGTRESLVVDFGESLDHAILDRALSIEGVSGQAEVSRDETRWSFRPDQPRSASEHTLVVLTLLEDLAGNQIGKAFEVDVFEQIETPEAQSASYRLSFIIPPDKR